MKNILYPIKFTPILKEKIWGGQRLTKQLCKLHKSSSATPIGESWEICGIENNVSVVSNGALKGKTLNELLIDYPIEILGDKNYKKYGAVFPLLFKFIDAKEDLSIQLHPDDVISNGKYQSFGKTEMWYIINSEEQESKIYNGLKHLITAEVYSDYVAQKKVLELIHTDVAKDGDAFFIPAGTVHAIGKGVLLAEIQQSSDITYRIYDWDRTDAMGNTRELHTEKALEVLNFNNYGSCKIEKPLKKTETDLKKRLVQCKHFTTNEINITNNQTLEIDVSTIDSFVVYMCIKGELTIQVNGVTQETLKKGETLLIPALADKITLKTTTPDTAIILETYI